MTLQTRWSLPPAKNGSRWSHEPANRHWREFEEARPRLLGALCSTLARVLALRPGIQVPGGLGSMGDFETWGVAVEGAMDWPPDAFLRPYRKRVGQSVSSALEGDPVAIAVKRFVDDRARRGALRGDLAWSEAAHELLPVLERFLPGMPPAPDDAGRTAAITRWGRRWPTHAAGLGKALKRLAPALRAEARIDVQQDRSSDERRWLIRRMATRTVERRHSPDEPSVPSPAAEPEQFPLLSGDELPIRKTEHDAPQHGSVTVNDGYMTGGRARRDPTDGDGNDGHDGHPLSEGKGREEREVVAPPWLDGVTDSDASSEESL
jgi:hypothetical protein